MKALLVVSSLPAAVIAALWYLLGMFQTLPAFSDPCNDSGGRQFRVNDFYKCDVHPHE